MYYLQSRYYDPEVGRFLNADAYASTGQGFLGKNMFLYCLNSPIGYTDQTGTRASMFFAVCVGDSCLGYDPLPGDGNYYSYDIEDMSYNTKTVYYNISKHDANQFYDTIKAGNFSYMYEFPILDLLIGSIDKLQAWADSLQLLLSLIDFYGSKSNEGTFDPEGRELYLEEGYTVVTFKRLYYNTDYWANETEYFIFDKNMRLIYNDVVVDVYMPGM